MLHLLPIRQLLRASIVLFGAAVLAAVYAGYIGTGDALSDVSWIIRWSSIAALALTLVPYAAWRWIPSVQRLVFPYLGGEWVGELNFSGPNGTGVRRVTLNVRHSLLRVMLILDSAESTSRTLAIHAERDAGINRDRLYYVYLNERKEGVVGAGERYRGLAVLRVEMKGHVTLHGDYFTEKKSNGTLTLTLRRHHPWWAIWK